MKIKAQFPVPFQENRLLSGRFFVFPVQKKPCESIAEPDSYARATCLPDPEQYVQNKQTSPVFLIVSLKNESVKQPLPFFPFGWPAAWR